MSPWSLRRRVTVTFVAASVLTTIALAIGVLSFRNLLEARNDVIDRYDPAGVAQRDMVSSLVRQESGLRGFILTGSEPFLEPYRNGIIEERRASSLLHSLLEGTHVRTDHLLRADELANDWRARYAEREIARVRTIGPGESTESELVDARRLFDTIQSELDLLQAEITDSRDVAKQDLGTATWALVAAMAFLAAVVFATGVFSWRAWSRWTMRPLDRLGHGARAVAAGHLAHPLTASGPPEIKRLGTDVEAMRARIVSEIDQLEEARAELDERARDLARSNADLEQFAYVASHDLQEPLRKITSFCQLLQQRYGGQLDERADQYIEFAVDGARRMQVLINDLLTFSRVGRSNEDFVDVDLGAVVQRAVGDLDPAIVEAEGKVVVGELPTVHGNPTLLAMLFRNLVGNSIKFRSEEPPQVHITAQRPRSNHEADWCITIDDNGIGVDHEYADKVFVIFQRLHARERYEGTGIGLALAKRIVEYHDGHIWIDAEPRGGHGTTIHFTIPQTPTTRSRPE